MRKFIFSLSLILIVFLVSCTKPTPTPGVDETGGTCSIDPQSTCAAPTSAVQPALYGKWVREGDTLNTLTIDEQTVNLVEKALDGKTHESIYDIKSVDWARDILTVQLTSLIVDGQTAEIPVEITYMKVLVDNDILYYSIAAEPPEKALLGPFNRE